MQAGSHRGPALLHVALDREEHGGCGDNAEITTLPYFDISPNVCGGGVIRPFDSTAFSHPAAVCSDSEMTGGGGHSSHDSRLSLSP